MVIKKVLTFLPEQNMNILRILCRFLHELIQFETENKMNPTNLSIVFAPNLLRPEGNQLGLMLSDSAYSTGLMKTLIESYEFLFEQNDNNEEKKDEITPGSPASINAASSADVATEEIKRLTINLNESPLSQFKPTPPPRKPLLKPISSPSTPTTLAGSEEPQQDPTFRRTKDVAPPPSIHKRSQTMIQQGSANSLFQSSQNSPRTLPMPFRKEDPLPQVPRSPRGALPVPQPKEPVTNMIQPTLEKKLTPPPPLPKKPSQIVEEQRIHRESLRGALPQPPVKDDTSPTKPMPPPPQRFNRGATTFIPPTKKDWPPQPGDRLSPKNLPTRPVSPKIWPPPPSDKVQ
jgi:hypothetical protein